ncbi:MAG: endonuclease/exonuclease/phosphatase family protein [Chitinophagales bacterium]
MRSILLLIFCALFGLVNAQDTLGVMTYNIRNCHAPDGVNVWGKRKHKVFDLLHKYRPDILGMQEVRHKQLEHLKQALKNYGEAGVGRDNGRRAGEYSPVFFRSDKFKLLQSGNFWLSETPEVPGSKNWDAALTRICSWVELQVIGTDSSFFVFNTHYDHRGEKARENSALLMAKKVAEIAGGKPFVITGDFNARPDSKAISNLIQNIPGLKDVFTTAPEHKTAEVNTDYGFNVSNKQGSKIDYIFCWSGGMPVSCEIIADNDGVFYPSDHLPFYSAIILFSVHK